MENINPAIASNLLPYDGLVEYHGPVMEPAIAASYEDLLFRSIAWQHDEAVIFGRHYVTARKVAWYADGSFPYKYSGKTRTALPWTRELQDLRNRVEHLAGSAFNACLLNLYHHGGEGMAWHSDDEKMLEEGRPIASLSFGASRRFCFRHKRTRETFCLVLEPGSLLVMKGETQENWWHSLPKALRVSTRRINLTFRVMKG